MFLLTYPRAWQFYSIESLHQLAQPMRASALWELRKRHCVPWHSTRQKINSGDTQFVPNFIEIRSVVSDKTQGEGQFRFHVM